MKYFTSDFAQFYADLASNNNRDWFLENKKRYESSVKQPFEQFVAVLIERLSEIHQDLTLQPKDAIFRINRDIRFSKDKTPYKIHSSALISVGGKKDKTTPGFYIQANHEDVRVYSGSHMLDKIQLQQVRQHIAANLKAFNTLINEKKFKETFGEVHGEKNKRLPPEFVDVATQQPLIANKSFYYFFKHPPSILTKDSVVDTLVNGYLHGLPLSKFLADAFS